MPVYFNPDFLISYVTIVQYQNQETGIGLIYQSYFIITSFICTHNCVYVCLVPHSFITFVDLFNHNNQPTELFLYHWGSIFVPGHMEGVWNGKHTKEWVVSVSRGSILKI